MLRNKPLANIVAVLAATAMAQTVTSHREKIAVVGATLIDVSGYGRSTNDIGDSVVLIDDGKITAAGSASQIPNLIRHAPHRCTRKVSHSRSH